MTMLALGRYAHWSRAELRGLSMAELEAYSQAAIDLEKEHNG